MLSTALGSLACALRTEPVQPLSGAALGVELSNGAPPSTHTLLGPIEATHGHGCGVIGKDGTLEGARNALREAASKRGADFVRVLESIEPHATRLCFEHEYRLRGLAYRGANQPAPAATCQPPCSSGYACQQGRCEPVCDPPCAVNSVCRADRSCAPRVP
jgi:hypothetical protein